jgi:hypothetical protein
MKCGTGSRFFGFLEADFPQMGRNGSESGSRFVRTTKERKEKVKIKETFQARPKP